MKAAAPRGSGDDPPDTGASGCCQLVHPAPRLDLLGHYVQPEPLLQRPGDRSANCSALPPELRAQLQKRPSGVRQHAKHSTSRERTMAILEEYMSKPPTRKPSSDPHKVAEAVFKKQAPKAEAPAITPGARELVSLRIDQDVLARFQADGPGWQDRINDALRRASGLQGEGSSE